MKPDQKNKDTKIPLGIHQLPFKGGLNKDKTPVRFYLPYRCENEAKKDGLCVDCLGKKNSPRAWPDQFRKHQPYYWGTVLDLIQNIGERETHIAFGPWFLERVKEFGISPENLAKARAAWAAAVAGLKDIPPLPDMGDGVVTQVPDKSSWTPAGNEKKKRGPAKKKVAAEPAPAVQEAKPVKKSKKLKTLDKPPTQTDVLEFEHHVPAAEPLLVVAPPVKVEVKPKPKKKMSTAAAPPPPQPIAILSEEKPVDVDNVETIEVTIKHIDGKDYYYDSRSHKNTLYNPKNGEEIGQYDSVLDKIIYKISIPDAE